MRNGTVLVLRDDAGQSHTFTLIEAREPGTGRLSQRDPRWASLQLGDDPRLTIGSHGCLVTCMSMLAGEGDVAAWHAALHSAGKFVKGTALVYLDLAWRGFPLTHLSSQFDKQPFPASELALLLSHLRAGLPAIVGVDFTPWPADTQYDEHYVLAVGVNERDEIQILDPWPRPDEYAPATLCPRYGETTPIALCRTLLYSPGGSK